ARETQKAKIERLEKEIEMWRELCSKMQKELSEFKELADDSYEKSSTYIQQCKRIELLEEQNEAYRLSVEHEKKMRKALVDNYEPEIERLNEEVQKLKSENKVRTHNERGAGRKSIFTEQEKESIRMYRLQGKTIKELAEMFSCSVGIIHKLIHE
ncbi:hypothetical protein, partial [Clostridium sp.]|uniref:hypothetical protein n=1 Tax=Clostridium sp. TaxID=1506 RepID=UPI003F7CF57D